MKSTSYETLTRTSPPPKTKDYRDRRDIRQLVKAIKKNKLTSDEILTVLKRFLRT